MKKLLLFLALPCFGQSVCITQFSTVAAVGVSATIDNRTKMCSQWVVTYNSTGFSAISIELDSALDVSGAPGAFGVMPGTVLTGTNCTTNPCTITGEGQFLINNYAPWVRLNFVSKTGTGSLTALALGTSVNPVSTIAAGGSTASPCPGTSGTPCVVDGPDAAGAPSTTPPVQIGGNDGTNVQRVRTDTSGRPIVVGGAATGAAPAGNPNLIASLDGAGNVLPLQTPTIISNTAITASGNTQLIAASGSTVIRLGLLEFTPDTSGNVLNFKLVYGTGSNCATGATDLTNVKTGVVAYSNTLNIPVPSGKALCFNLDAATPAHVTTVYSQY